MLKKLKKFNWKSLIITILGIAILLGAVAGTVALIRRDTKTISSFEFKRGALDENGEYVKSDKSIYTENAFDCIGLRVEPDFEFKGTYDVFYYDYDGNLVEKKLGLQKVYDEDFPLAKMARIVINPEAPEDVKENDFKIKFWEVNSYAKKLKITVDKKQEYLYEDCLNLYNAQATTLNKTFKNETDPTPASYDSKNLVDVTDAKYPAKLSNAVTVDGTYDKYDIFVHLEVGEGRWPIVALFGADGKTLRDENGECIFDLVNSTSVVKPIWVKLTVEVPELESYDGVHLMVSMPDDSECYIFGYND